jgi:hypothetical protein
MRHPNLDSFVICHHKLAGMRAGVPARLLRLKPLLEAACRNFRQIDP